MNELFLKIINMSISASWLALVVLVLRLVLKKAPKWVNVLLWGIVAIRLICPFSIESSFSLIPQSLSNGDFISEWTDDYIEEVSFIHDNSPYFDAAIAAGRKPISTKEGGYYVVTKYDQLDEPSTVGNTVIPILTVVWVSGMLLLTLYTAISYWRLHRKVDTAVLLYDNIFQSETVSSSFILGIIKPQIYLPFQMNKQDLEHVVAHEQAHIRRKDHWWKPFGFLLLTIHWFNLLMWIAYILLCRDIELACDEKVIKELDNEQRANYTQALVACSVNRRMITACPLAFGEVGVKERVKSVMNYKKPTFWIIILAVISCMVVTICFLTTPVDNEPDLSFLNYKNAISLVADVDEVMAIYCPFSDDGSDASIQIGVATGVDLAKQLDRWDWKKCAAPRQSLSSSGSVEFVIDDNYRITVHQQKSGSLHQYAVVNYQEDVRYYRIDKSDYPDAVALVHAVKENTQEKDAGKTYIYEKDGFHGDFTITLYDNGTFTYCEGLASSYLGMGTWNQDGNTITLHDDEKVGYAFVNHFQFDGDDLVFMEEASSNFIYVKVKNGEYFRFTGETFKSHDGVNDTKQIEDSTIHIQPKEDALDAAISAAILEHNKGKYDSGEFACESHIVLATEENGEASSDKIDFLNIYALVLYQEYESIGNTVQDVGGGYIPTVLTFEITENGSYILDEYWEPRDGSYYVKDIQVKFPGASVEDALNAQEYIEDLQTQNHDKALAYLNSKGSLNLRIADLLDTIQSSPVTSSNPGDYIEAHKEDYQELLSYGKYTLRYCFSEFLLGGQTDLKGELMHIILDELAPEAKLKLEVENGQDYFEEWKTAAIQVSEQQDMDWIEKYQPAIYLLLQMMNE